MAQIGIGRTGKSDCILEKDVRVAPGAAIGPRAQIGEGTFIGPNAVIGPGVSIGRECARSAAMSQSRMPISATM